MNKEQLKDKVKVNVPGWRCLQHRDGWLVGTNEGVTCYGDEQLAKAALTLANMREGRSYGEYKLVIFAPDPDRKNAGQHTPKLSIIDIARKF